MGDKARSHGWVLIGIFTHGMRLETDGHMYAGNTPRKCETLRLTVYLFSWFYTMAWTFISSFNCFIHIYIDSLRHLSFLHAICTNFMVLIDWPKCYTWQLSLAVRAPKLNTTYHIMLCSMSLCVKRAILNTDFILI